VSLTPRLLGASCAQKVKTDSGEADVNTAEAKLLDGDYFLLTDALAFKFLERETRFGFI